MQDIAPPVKVERWVTSDEKIHDSQAEAVRHETILTIIDTIRPHWRLSGNDYQLLGVVADKFNLTKKPAPDRGQF
jgi:hypothetical protein